MYCGIDVAKNKSRVCILDEDKKRVAEFSITHNKEGVEKLKPYLSPKSIIGMEATGCYSKALYEYLKRDYNVHYVDNVQMKNFARLHSPTTKNDIIDARLIAKFLTHDFKIVHPIPESELKDLCKLYQKMLKQLTRTKYMFQNQLNVIFPELEGRFCITTIKCIGNLLLLYPTPKDIANASEEELLAVIKKHSPSGLRKGSFFTGLRELAKDSIGVPDYPTSSFKYTIQMMLFFQGLFKEIKTNMGLCLKKTPYYQLINEYGYGAITLAAIVGEVGDVRRFANHKKFVRYCGLDVSQAESGTSIHKKGHITKRGNSLLRSTFFLLAVNHIGKKTPTATFFKRLKEAGKHPKICVVAAARKLAIKAYYDMMKCHTPAT